MSTIYLFRHGQSEFNLSKTFTGWIDAKLTPLGIEQAKALGEMLKDKTIDLAYSSSLSRAIDTLKEVLIYHPECRETIIDDRIIKDPMVISVATPMRKLLLNMAKNNLINGTAVGPIVLQPVNLLPMSKSGFQNLSSL